MDGSNYICRIDYEVVKTGTFGFGQTTEEEVYRDCYKNMFIYGNDTEYPITIYESDKNEDESLIFDKELITITATEDDKICIIDEQNKCTQEIKDGSILSGWICFMNDNKSNYFCEYLVDEDSKFSLLSVESKNITPTE